MRLHIILSIFRKEIREALRDRATLIVVIGLPLLLYPLMITAVTKLQRTQAESEAKRASTIAVWGNAPQALADWLQRTNAFKLTNGLGLSDTLRTQLASGALPIWKTETDSDTDDAPEENAPQQKDTAGTNAAPANLLALAARELLETRDADAVLVIPSNFSDALKLHQLGRLAVYFDSVRPQSMTARARLADELAEFRKHLLQQREEERSLPPGFTRALETRIENVAPPRRKAGQLLSVALPFILIMLSATGALHASIDLTAGEKDRATMQTLLCAPVHSLEIVAGKFLTVWAISFIAAMANATSLSLTLMRVTASIGGLSLSPLTVLLVLPCLLPVTCTIAALFLAVATMARDAKDAGNFLGATLAMLTLPMAITLAPGVELSPATAFVPLLNIALLIKALFVGEATLELTFLALTASAAYAMLALLFAARVFSREQVLLGGKGAARSLVGGRRREPGNVTPGFAIAAFCIVLVGLFYGSFLMERTGIIGGVLLNLYGFILLPALLLAWWNRFPMRETFSLRLPHWRGVIGSVLIGCTAAIGVAGIVMRLLPAPEALLDDLRRLLTLGDPPAPLWLAWLVLAISPALCEELLFRGLIFSGFRKLGPKAAIFLSALLFGLAHASIYRLLPTFALGLILGFTLWRTRSILCAMLIHALNNGLAVTLVYHTEISERLGVTDLEMVPWPLTLGCLAVTAVGMALLRAPRAEALSK